MNVDKLSRPSLVPYLLFQRLKARKINLKQVAESRDAKYWENRRFLRLRWTLCLRRKEAERDQRATL